MVSVLDSLSPGRGHCVMFLAKALYSYSASLHPGVQMGTSIYGLASHPGGNSNTPSRFKLMKPELSASSMGHLGL